MSFSRYSIDKKQISTDHGVTWEDVIPGETRQGTLVGVARTLLECEDMACELEEWRYTVIDGILPDEFCGDYISTLPEGIAMQITQTAGAWCCNTWWYEVIGGYDYIQKRWQTVAQGGPICSGNMCPGWEYSKDVMVQGMELQNNCGIHGCQGTSKNVCTCFVIDKLMPWAEGKETWKMVQGQHWTRPHCSDEWEMDGEPVIVAIGERWHYLREDFDYRYWQHQVATEFDSNGNVTKWEDVGNVIMVRVSTVDLPSDIELIDSVHNDGILSSYKSVEALMCNADNPGSVTGLMYSTYKGYYGDIDKYPASGYSSYFNTGRYISASSDYKTALFYEVQGQYSSTVSGAYPHRFPEENESARQEIASGFYTKRLGSFKNNDVYGSYAVFGMSPDIWYPYRKYQNIGATDDYYNFSEIGFIRRNGDILTMEYNLGNYTTSAGTEYHLLSYKKSTIMSIGDDVVTINFTEDVTSIPSNLFSNKRLLTSVSMPYVNSIGANAFSGCTSLSSVTFSRSNTTIYDSCFQNSGIRTISLNNVTSLGNYAFTDCANLEYVDIGNTLTNIPQYCFLRDISLSSVTIPSNITRIGAGAFRDCSGLTSVTLNNGLSYIGSKAFDGTAIKEVSIPNTVTSYGGAFWGSSNLEKVTINTTATIEENTFYNCKIKEVILTVTTPPVCYNGRYTWDRFFTFAPEAVILVPASAVDAYKNDPNQGSWGNVKNMIYPIPNETEWVNIGYICVNGLRYDYEHKRGRNTAYSNDWFWLPEYRTVGEPYGECDGTEPY